MADDTTMSGLIEGLPDEVAFLCLARVPFYCHGNLRLVCRSWRAALCSREVFKARCESGASEELLCVLAIDPGNVWQLYDPCRDHWLTLTVMPSQLKYLYGFGVASIAGKLFVLGGCKSPAIGYRHAFVMATNEVWSYDPFCREWSRRANMLVPRTKFACCSLDGKIFVVGGFTSSGETISKAEIYDSNTDTWRFLPDLPHTYATTCYCVVIGGKIHVFHEGPSVIQILDDGQQWWSVDHFSLHLGFPIAAVREECYVVDAGGFVLKQSKKSSRNVNTIFYGLVSSALEFERRTRFGLIGLGDDLYVVGGVSERWPNKQFRGVRILSVNSSSPTWRKGSPMIGSGGIITGCALLKL